MLISFKDWIATIRKTSGKLKQLQEDILSDDNFPDTEDFDEMLSYLKKNKASVRIITVFAGCYRQYRNRVLKRAMPEKYK